MKVANARCSSICARRVVRSSAVTATAAGAVIGAGIGHQQGMRRYGAVAAPQPSTVQRCETRYRDEYQERIDGYRVTYVYHGRRQVTQLPYRPGERIRVRVDVSPAE